MTGQERGERVVVTSVQSANYWSATTNAENFTITWAKNFFGNGATDTDSKTNSPRRAWHMRRACMRMRIEDSVIGVM